MHQSEVWVCMFSDLMYYNQHVEYFWDTNDRPYLLITFTFTVPTSKQ